MAPWNTMLMSVQRLRRERASSSSAVRSSPSKVTEPLAMRPFSGSSRRMASAVVVLPQPDSPTRPTASPASTSKLMPSTARTVPVAHVELDHQVAHLEQGHRAPLRRRSTRPVDGLLGDGLVCQG